jgi:hypothetical protein
MKNASQTLMQGKLLPFINQHWFKIGVAALALYAFLSKDFAFQINIQAPGTPTTVPATPDSRTAKKSRETLTDNISTGDVVATTFDFLPSWGNDGSPMIERIARLDNNSIQQFFHRFQHVAESEQEKFGIPAAIILANSLLNSQAGKAPYAQQGHNFFRLTCSDDWQGQTQDDDRGLCLRSYDNAWMSFRDHSLFFTTGAHAAFRDIPASNYKAWARAMNESPYNKEKQLDEQLIRIIERFKLAD